MMFTDTPLFLLIVFVCIHLCMPYTHNSYQAEQVEEVINIRPNSNVFNWKKIVSSSSQFEKHQEYSIRDNFKFQPTSACNMTYYTNCSRILDSLNATSRPIKPAEMLEFLFMQLCFRFAAFVECMGSEYGSCLGSVKALETEMGLPEPVAVAFNDAMSMMKFACTDTMKQELSSSMKCIANATSSHMFNNCTQSLPTASPDDPCNIADGEMHCAIESITVYCNSMQVAKDACYLTGFYLDGSIYAGSNGTKRCHVQKLCSAGFTHTIPMYWAMFTGIVTWAWAAKL